MKVTRRAQLHAWRGRVRGTPASVLLVMAGAAAAIYGATLVARWCVGLVTIAISVALVAVGLLRDDHHRAPPPEEHTVARVLDDYRRSP